MNTNYADKKGIRIWPAKIEFTDVEAGNTYRISINVKNIHKSSRVIRYYPPQQRQDVFTFHVDNPEEQTVAPGMDVPAWIEFRTNTELTADVVDRLVITVTGDVVEVPVIAYMSKPILSIQKRVDFGKFVVANKVLQRDLLIHNTGNRLGQFHIEYHGSKPISIVPSAGHVEARSVLKARVEYVATHRGVFHEDIEVSLEGQSETTRVRVSGNAVVRRLKLLHLNDGDTDEQDTASVQSEGAELRCVQFGATYYGTDRTVVAMLYNESPEPLDFISVLDENAVGQEAGIDLSKPILDLRADVEAPTTGEHKRKRSLNAKYINDLNSLVTVIPSQGHLNAFQKMPLCFRFSPRSYKTTTGFDCLDTSPTCGRQDFALFLRFQMVGQAHLTQKEQEKLAQSDRKLSETTELELAVTGTAMPVLLNVRPGMKLKFPDCPVGAAIHYELELVNESALLPIRFAFRPLANFSVSRRVAQIPRGASRDVVLSFTPKQIGQFEVKQFIDILGFVCADNVDPRLLLINPVQRHLRVIQSFALELLAASVHQTTVPRPLFSAGIDPACTNAVGVNTDHLQFDQLAVGCATFGDLNLPKHFGGSPKTITEMPRVAVLKALDFAKSKKKLQQRTVDGSLIALPNDRAASIRPSDPHYRSIFTNLPRNTYLDRDYQLTQEEVRDREINQRFYLEYIDLLRKTREHVVDMRHFRETNNALDIGFKPAHGLKPKWLKLEDLKPDPKPEPFPNANFSLLSTKTLQEAENKANQNQTDCCNSVPTTKQEIADSKRTLTPHELHQVIITPAVIDFGEVCLRSVSQINLVILNNLEHFVFFELLIGDQQAVRELRQTSPLTQVVPPQSKVQIPVIFESSIRGKFQRNVKYRINQKHENSIIVFADVVPVQLELSTDTIVIDSKMSELTETGTRSIVTLTNRLNASAEFTWQPILSDKGTAFSIRPASGWVEAFRSLECEVVFHAYYQAASESDFLLQVHGGNQLKLKCIAKFGTSKVQLGERRLIFGNIPINLTTVRVGTLNNEGESHAYYYIRNPHPRPGMTIAPSHGVVPVGGSASFQVQMTPVEAVKFDTDVDIEVRQPGNFKIVQLRIDGEVEMPSIDVDARDFDFGGVYVGSKFVFKFLMANRAKSRAKVVLDLSRYSDFHLQPSSSEEVDAEDASFVHDAHSKLYTVLLRAQSAIHLDFVFAPSQVASYDFMLPVLINNVRARTPLPTPLIDPAKQNENIIGKKKRIVRTPDESLAPTDQTAGTTASDGVADQPRSKRLSKAVTPKRRVIGTALRQPLRISHNTVSFILPAAEYENTDGLSDPAATKSITITNITEMPIRIKLAASQTAVPLADVDQSDAAKNVHSSKQTANSSSTKHLDAFDIRFDDNQCVTTEMNPLITLESGQTRTLHIRFSSENSGTFKALVDIVLLDGHYNRTYQQVTVFGTYLRPQFWFAPQAVILTPCPLSTRVDSDEMRIKAFYYTRKTHLLIDYPHIEASDGTVLNDCLKLEFLDSPEILPTINADEWVNRNPNAPADASAHNSGKSAPVKVERDDSLVRALSVQPCVIRCRVSFLSPHPISFNKAITVRDQFGLFSATLTVTATADNCMLTVYPFLAKYYRDYRIVCEQGKAIAGARVKSAKRGQNGAHRHGSAGSTSQVDVGEAICLPVGEAGLTGSLFDDDDAPLSNTARSTMQPAKPPSTAVTTTTSFECSTQSYETSTSVASESTESYDLATPLREGAVNKLPTFSESVLGVERGISALLLEHSRTALESNAALFPESNTEIGRFYADVLQAVQRWFTVFGWPNGPFPIQIPQSVRAALSRVPPMDDEQYKIKAQSGAPWDTGSKGSKKELRTIYDMITNLCGRSVPGIAANSPLPNDPIAKVKQIYWQHQTLLTFLTCQGACLAHVKAEHLLDAKDYSLWCRLERKNNVSNFSLPIESLLDMTADDLPMLPMPTALPSSAKLRGHRRSATRSADDKSVDGENGVYVPGSSSSVIAELDTDVSSRSLVTKGDLQAQLFEAISKQAWNDVLLQTLKTFVLSRVTPRSYKSLPLPPGCNKPLPNLNLNPLSSNIYSISERILLVWLNFFLETYRTRIWKQDPPAARWIVNFDYDLLDGIVLAAVMGAYCPFVVDTHLRRMYTRPETAEQCFHNALLVVDAMRFLGFDFQINAIDITDPNPINLMLLCAHLYQSLPQYLAKTTVKFTGALHEAVTRQISISNPSIKPMQYLAVIAGDDARDFSVAKNLRIVNVPARGSVPVNIEFRSRFVKPVEAVLLLLPRRTVDISTSGCTLVFALHGIVEKVTTQATVNCRTECYVKKPVSISVTNPYAMRGTFSVLLFESCSNSVASTISEAEGDQPAAFSVQHERTLIHVLDAYWNARNPKPKKVRTKRQTPRSKVGISLAALQHADVQSAARANENSSPQTDAKITDADTKSEYTITGEETSKRPNALDQFEQPQLATFSCRQTTVQLEANATAEIVVNCLPFCTGPKSALLVLSDANVGEFVYAIEAECVLPFPIVLPNSGEPDDGTGRDAKDGSQAMRGGSAESGSTQSGSTIKRARRLNSAQAATTGAGYTDVNERAVYWRCDQNQTLNDVLLVPVRNEQLETALIEAAQQHLTEIEWRRRQLTKTLSSLSLAKKAIDLLTLKIRSAEFDDLKQQLNMHQLQKRRVQRALDSLTFELVCDSPHFQVPTNVLVPIPKSGASGKESKDAASNKQNKAAQQDNGMFSLPITFMSKNPGRYGCNIVMRSKANANDVRVIRIECLVIPETSQAEFRFDCPALQTVVQALPIINDTDNEWPVEAVLDQIELDAERASKLSEAELAELLKKGREERLHGEALEFFSGPQEIIAKARAQTNFPVTFAPLYESFVHGRLRLINKSLKTEQVFTLRGTATKPKAAQTVEITCRVNERSEHTVDVANFAKWKLLFDVETEIPFLKGPDRVCVYSGRRAPYSFSLCPRRSGTYKGVLRFIAREDRFVERDSDDEEMYSLQNTFKHPFESWYKLLINVESGEPVETKKLTLNCLSSSTIEIPLTATDKDLRLVPVLNELPFLHLVSAEPFVVPAGKTVSFKINCLPTRVGNYETTLFFLNDTDHGEFWYKLCFRVDPPAVIKVPPLKCEIGHWTQTDLTLSNPTGQAYSFTPRIMQDGKGSFMLDLETDDMAGTLLYRPIKVSANSSKTITLRFRPSALGYAYQHAFVVFSSNAIGECKFEVTGCGLLPKTQPPSNLDTQMGGTKVLILSYVNPFDVPVNVTVKLLDPATSSTYPDSDDSAERRTTPLFSTMLKSKTLILQPQQLLDIPVMFAPQEDLLRSVERKMGRVVVEALCVVASRRQDGGMWSYCGNPNAEVLTDDVQMEELRWLYPLFGTVSDSGAQSDSRLSQNVTVIESSLFALTEHKLELVLPGVTPTSRGAVKPSEEGEEKDVDAELLADFTYEFHAQSPSRISMKSNASALESTEILKFLTINLQSAHVDPLTALTKLEVRLRFTPKRTFSADCFLTIRSSSNGQTWPYPLKLLSRLPEPDDTIEIKATQLNKIFSVEFALTSTTDFPLQFETFLLDDNNLPIVSTDIDNTIFTVDPRTGTLPPRSNDGIPFRVSFKPQQYGRTYKSRLLINGVNASLQWLYVLSGQLSDYTPPDGSNSKFRTPTIVNLRRMSQVPLDVNDRRNSRNFVVENIVATQNTIPE